MHITITPGGACPPRHELDVLECAVQGLTPAQAAERLGVTTSVVRRELRAIQTRLGARNIAHALYICIERGHITITAHTEAHNDNGNHGVSDPDNGIFVGAMPESERTR